MVISELLIKELQDSIGKHIKMFLENGFHFEGRLLECDGVFVKFFDDRKQNIRFEKMDQISECELT